MSSLQLAPPSVQPCSLAANVHPFGLGYVVGAEVAPAAMAIEAAVTVRIEVIPAARRARLLAVIANLSLIVPRSPCSEPLPDAFLAACHSSYPQTSCSSVSCERMDI